MIQYYKQLALATLMMTTLGLSSCQSKAKDEPTVEPPVAFAAPGGWVNGPNGYVEPYHDPAYPNSPYFTHEEAVAINDKLKASGSKLYLPSPEEMVRYFPMGNHSGGMSPLDNGIIDDDDMKQFPVRLVPNREETVQFGRYAKPIQATSTFLHGVRKQDRFYLGVTYAMRFFDQPKHRIFQRWSYSIPENQIMFGEPRNILAGTISFLPYEESATIGGEKAPVFTEEYWKSRASEVKSITILNWGFDEPGSVYTFGSYGFYHTSSNFYAGYSISSGFSLNEGTGPSGVIHLFEEGK